MSSPSSTALDDVPRKYGIGLEIPPITKQIAQERITLFERAGGYVTPTFHTDAASAKSTIGLSGPMASGRMSMSFAVETLRRFFGEAIYNRSGMIDLRFLRPVRDGDTITISGKVSQVVSQANGQRVVVDVSIHNQHGEATASGHGAAVVPSGLFLADESTT